MEENPNPIYPLDSSGIVHLASMGETYTNTFRISVTLTRKVCPKTLQRAFDQVGPHFPTIAAGIRRGIFQYKVIPVHTMPAVQPDAETLACMSKEMIRTCAMRVLYQGKTISVEIFHSLTDGYGGLVFVQALLAEYLFLTGDISEKTAERGRWMQRIPQEKQLADDYITYAGEETTPVNHLRVYCLPGDFPENQRTHEITKSYDLQEMLEISHRFHVSLTVFLTAVMAASIVEMQKQNRTKGEYEPVQIMVPVNLRRKFLSVSVRNFSLYALPCVEPDEFSLDLKELTGHLDRQLSQQFSRENLGRMISASVRMQKRFPVCCIPMVVKEALLRAFFSRFGERNSCLTLSNLGEVVFPEGIRDHVEQVRLILSPRRNAPYNCGVLSYNGRLVISFSRRGELPGLEQIFFRRLEELGCRKKNDIRTVN